MTEKDITEKNSEIAAAVEKGNFIESDGLFKSLLHKFVMHVSEHCTDGSTAVMAEQILKG